MRKQEFSRALKIRQDRLMEAYFSGVENAIDSSINYIDGGCWGPTKQSILKDDKYGVIPHRDWKNEEDGFLENPSMEGLMYRMDRHEYPNIKNRKMRVYKLKVTDITDSSDTEDQKWVKAAQGAHDRDVLQYNEDKTIRKLYNERWGKR